MACALYVVHPGYIYDFYRQIQLYAYDEHLPADGKGALKDKDLKEYERGNVYSSMEIFYKYLFEKFLEARLEMLALTKAYEGKEKQSKAEAVKPLLVSYGVDESRMTCLGLDPDNPWHLNNLDENGQMIEEIAVKNRCVYIIDTQSSDAGLLTYYYIPHFITFITRRPNMANIRDSVSLTLDWGEAFSRARDIPGLDRSKVTPYDALIQSIMDRGRVDLDYISELTGMDKEDEVIRDLKGQIYQNPTVWKQNHDPYDGWETSEEYLSGNILRKYKEAKMASVHTNRFSVNMEALQELMPKATAQDEIYVSLGSPWVPPSVIDDFMEYLFKDTGYGPYSNSQIYHVKHDDYEWEIPYKGRYNKCAAVTHIYGTQRLNALQILEMTLNMKTATVYDEVESYTTKSGVARVLNEEETILAVEKQQLMINEFREWVWTDPERSRRLMDIFETKYGSTRLRHFNGEGLTFPGMAPDVKLLDYQKNAVARIIFTRNTLLAHEVGSGKTYVMIAAAAKLKQMGLSKKNMFVVPNSITGQWLEIYKTIYPDSNVLCVDSKSFVPAKRQEVLKAIRDRKYDGIIIAYSCFDQIPISKAYYRQQLEDEIVTLQRQIKCGNATTSAAEARLKLVKRKLSRLIIGEGAEAQDEEEFIFFDELGVTRLFVDEAHNFKNVPVNTRSSLIQGINSGGSKKCQSMLDKVRIVQRMDQGGVVFATATPITNSITDIFVMQMYLQSFELSLMDIQNFDNWVGMFAERTTDFEIDIDTNSYKLASRYGKFHNLQVLASMLASIADFHKVDESVGIPRFDGYTDISVPKTKAFMEFLEDISTRADDVRHRRVKSNEDNLLKITTDGRKAALDLRLVDEDLYQEGPSKVKYCAGKIYDIYLKTADEHGVQAVFCDTSTPKQGFNIYDELKEWLVVLGIPENEIAYIHDVKTEAKRAALIRKVTNGSIRVLIGSTFKMGIGLNIQTGGLVALHHLDVPWRPADMTQRNGRILRQGNPCEQVEIYRYYTTGSFDAYSWQLLETKQRFIDQLLSGAAEDDSSDDIGDTALSYAEIKAMSVGNPLLKKRVEVANELQRYRALQRKLIESNRSLEDRRELMNTLIINQRLRVKESLEDSARLRQRRPNPNADKKLLRQERRDMRIRLDRALKKNVLRTKDRELFDYKGFRIILPANMTAEEPYVWLQGANRYKVELGDSEQGNLTRIDHFLDGFTKRIGEMEQQIRNKEIEITNIEHELAKADGYSDRIAELKKQLAEIDEELEVNKNGKRKN